MKDTKYLSYLLHTTILGIEISKIGNKKVLKTCDRLEQAMIWIEDKVKKENIRRKDISTIDQKEG